MEDKFIDCKIKKIQLACTRVNKDSDYGIIDILQAIDKNQKTENLVSIYSDGSIISANQKVDDEVYKWDFKKNCITQQRPEIICYVCNLIYEKVKYNPVI